MSTSLPDPSCPGCAARDKQIADLQQQMQQMQQHLSALQERIARAETNSSNSSKPPSSDIVKPPKPAPKKGKKRRRGGQLGHTKYERTFHLADADVVHAHRLDCCPSCASPHLFHFAGAEQTHYQYELVEKPIRLHAYQSHLYGCSVCHQIHAAPFPDAVRQGGLAGPRLTGLIGFLKGGGHVSYTTLQALLDDGLGMPLSTGMLAKVIDKVSQALQPIYQPLVEALPQQKQLNIDEPSHKDQGDLLWTWVFSASAFTVFHIAPSRASQVLEDLLTSQCQAVLGHDCFSAYRAYMEKPPSPSSFAWLISSANCAL